MKISSSGISRRRFIGTTAAAIVLPLVLPGCATGSTRRPRPSGRINVGVVGWGMQGPSNTRNFLNEADCQVIAVCDLDPGRRQAAVGTINEHYNNQDCKPYADFREMFDREDLDAVMIAVPDHWHEIIATEAARHKLDIYGEKPLARTIAEQQAIVRAVQQNGIIWQTGSWQRSQAQFRKAAEIVRSGLIGQVTRVEVGLPSGHTDFSGSAPALLEKLKPLGITSLTQVVPGTEAWNLALSEPPQGFDYNFWLGPARQEPYIKQRVYMNWRWNYNTGGGQLLDWVGHHVDIAHWGLGFDNSGPLEIEGQGEFPAPNAIWNTAGKYRIELKYPQDISMTIAGGHDDIREGTKWIGTEGWVWVNRGGFNCSNPAWKKGKNLPEELRKVKLYESPGHYRNFLDSIKSRQPTITPVETAHHSAIPGHLGLIAMLTGRKIRWDNATETIIGDPEASKLLTREYRAPWKMA